MPVRTPMSVSGPALWWAVPPHRGKAVRARCRAFTGDPGRGRQGSSRGSMRSQGSPARVRDRGRGHGGLQASTRDDAEPANPVSGGVGGPWSKTRGGLSSRTGPASRPVLRRVLGWWPGAGVGVFRSAGNRTRRYMICVTFSCGRGCEEAFADPAGRFSVGAPRVNASWAGGSAGEGEPEGMVMRTAPPVFGPCRVSSGHYGPGSPQIVGAESLFQILGSTGEPRPGGSALPQRGRRPEEIEEIPDELYRFECGRGLEPRSPGRGEPGPRSETGSGARVGGQPASRRRGRSAGVAG